MYLLDINVLLAFAYDEHVLHRRASLWIKHVESENVAVPRFATCSITELGFILSVGHARQGNSWRGPHSRAPG